MTETKDKILVTGATGQIGSELIPELRKLYGSNKVIALGHKKKPADEFINSGPFEFVDVTDKEALRAVIKKYQITVIYHLASVLSAVGEKNPDLAWKVGLGSLRNILDLAQELKIKKIFWPSSIAAFGPETPKENTPNETIMRPTTMYGITKVTGELLCEYYHQRYGLDVRMVRFPGIISYKTLPGGGTTDYAIAIFYGAIKDKKYNCFVTKDTVLPMMYMPDCIKAILDLMNADASKLKHRCFNLSSMRFSARELAEEIKKNLPEFKCTYTPDFRQKIAESWPKYLDDRLARKEWGWNPKYNLSLTVQEMLAEIKKII